MAFQRDARRCCHRCGMGADRSFVPGFLRPGRSASGLDGEANRRFFPASFYFNINLPISQLPQNNQTEISLSFIILYYV